MTYKRGFHEPNLLSVKGPASGQTVLNCRLVPGSRCSDGKIKINSVYPRFPGQNDAQHLDLRGSSAYIVEKV